MTLQERIAWCERMADTAIDIEDFHMYASELCGLRGEPLTDLGNAKWYQRGLSDRATLLKLETHNKENSDV